MTTASVLRRATTWNRSLLVLLAAMVLLTLVTAVGIFADDRVLTGAPIWLKPFKFSVSFVLYSATLAWMLSLLPRRSRVLHAAVVLIVAMSFVEMVIIVGQVIRGETSHYNQTSALNEFLWMMMGQAILGLFVAHLVVGIAVLRARFADRVSATGVRLGLFGALLGMAAAIPMTLPTAAPPIENIVGGHSVGTVDGGPGLPVVGWSTVGGDLRIGHFVGLHMLQAMPLLAFLLNRYATRLTERTRFHLLLVAGGAYTLVTLSLTWQALRGQSLIHPDGLTLTAWSAIAAVTVAAALAVLARNRRPDLALAA